ncbi:MAG: WD40/YVTN/BNR-like repeat-containing protein, partial [Gemmatimonadaceae bacterium]
MPECRSASILAGLALIHVAAAPLAAQTPSRDTAMINRSPNPVLSSFRFRSIGPASMGGRVDDIEVAPSDPNVIYVGYATGGVFKSENNGTTFAPVFEAYGSASIGDIAIHPTNANIVYVGTGEANNRQTSSFGDGIYKTEDGGKTFTNVGLKETQTIARIVIDPRSPDVLYVAVPGHLFGPSPDGGIYKTTDGGKTWTKIKYVDENTGFTDIVMDPSNSRVLYAASYQRRRSGCCYNGGGAGSALWKSDNAGQSWERLTGSGLPSGTLGRIALAVAKSNPNIVYAQIEAAPAAEAGEGAAAGAPVAGGAAGAGRGGGYDWCDNAGPGRGFGGGRGGRGAAPPDTNRTPPAVDGNRSGIFRSDNKGKSWAVVSNCDARPLYFSQIRIDPSDDQNIYVAGVHMAKSLDGGKTFVMLDNAGGFFNMGEDQHAIWIDPKNGSHILRGTDAGFMTTWDQGKTWEYVRTMATGLAYWVTADMGHTYYVYSGMQDNDSWAGASATRGRIGITGQDWFHLTGGDGFQTAVDPTDFHIIYSSSQDGSVSRVDLRTGRATSIRPVAPPAAGADSSAGGGRGGRGGRIHRS